MVCCTVCGAWVPSPGRDRLDICNGCMEMNFSGAQEYQPDAPSAREALEAYAFPQPIALTLSPRQVHHLRRLHERWNQAREES